MIVGITTGQQTQTDVTAKLQQPLNNLTATRVQTGSNRTRTTHQPQSNLRVPLRDESVGKLIACLLTKFQDGVRLDAQV